jgi:hypothetical protein
MSGKAPDTTVLDESACPACGRESCPGDCRVPGASTLQAVVATDLLAEPAPVAIVEGVAWADCVSVVVAESGAGKTFVLLDLAAAVSADLEWHGREVHGGPVAYVSFEGDALGVRLRALREAKGARLEGLYIVRATEPVSPLVGRDGLELPSPGELHLTAAVQRLQADLASAERHPIRLLIFDTVRASMTGSEDRSESVAAYLRAVRRVMSTAPGAAAILAHHAGWQDGEAPKRRERGSSSWRGNVDATLYLQCGDEDRVRGEVRLELAALKTRDAERPSPLRLIRRRVELAEAKSADLRRGPLTSCVVDLDRRSVADRQAEQEATLRAVDRAVDLSVLRVLAEPTPTTSQMELRQKLRLKNHVVRAALCRLADRGWLEARRQRQPYQLSDAGRLALRSAGDK